MDPAIAANRLKEVKRIFDDQKVVFWLGSGTCLGCIRENRFIPWDDEIDTASIIGMHGLDEETIYRMGDVFKENGFYPRIRSNPQYMSVAFIKDGVRTDWTCHRIVDGGAIEFPGVKLPLHLFTQPKKIEFIGQKFLVPSPPEEYLRLKYGSEWLTPKGPGFEADVVMKIGDGDNLSRWNKFQRALSVGKFPRANSSVKVFDRDGRLVRGAEVIVAGLDRSKTDRYGVAKFYVPHTACYAMVIRYEKHQEILYEEWLSPSINYIYRPGPIITPEQHYKGGVRAMALEISEM
ncbi:MAG: Phosphorylcholine metabolism protein LicD [Chloroflexi bacterium]|nr:MAG: Phosphorylcholine metabolism protein LicD [Chloroflexota bacterium]